MHARPLHFSVVATLLCVSAISGCSDPPPGKLFDETGAWSVVRYELGEGLKDIVAMTREDSFMLSFDTDNNVMTTAACGNEMSGFTPADSTCRLSPTTTSWQCACYSYAFQEDIMQMIEFSPGSPPPEVEFNPDLLPGANSGSAGESGGGETAGEGTAGGGEESGGGETGGAMGVTTVVRIAAIPDTQDTYDFAPLPIGVFGGNGANDHFVFEIRSNTLFNQAYDDPDGRATCEPCVPGVGG